MYKMLNEVESTAASSLFQGPEGNGVSHAHNYSIAEFLPTIYQLVIAYLTNLLTSLTTKTGICNKISPHPV